MSRAGTRSSTCAPPGGRLTVVPANSGGFGATFTGTAASEGIVDGTLLSMTGNSMIEVSGLQVGRSMNAAIASLGTAPLLLNDANGNDVIVVRPARPSFAGLVV